MGKTSLAENWRLADRATRRLVLHWAFWLALPLFCCQVLRQAVFAALTLFFTLALIKRTYPALARILVPPCALFWAAFLLKPGFISQSFAPVWTYPWLPSAGASLALAIAYRGTRQKTGADPKAGWPGYLAAAGVMALALLLRRSISDVPWLSELAAGAMCLFLFCESLLDKDVRANWAKTMVAPREVVSRMVIAMGLWPAFVWVCLAMLCALALDFLSSQGFQGTTDEGSNFAAAYYYLHTRGQIWQHTHSLIYDQAGKYLFDVAGCRLGLVLPSTMAYWLDGGNLGGITALCLGYHLALVALVYQIGSRLFGRLVGALSSFVAASWPFILPFAATPWPEVPMALWSGLSFLLFLEAFPGMLGRTNRAPFQRLVLCVASGIALGWAYAIKESGLLFLVPLGFLLAFEAWKLKKYRGIAEVLAFVAGLGLVFATETAILSCLFGELTTKSSLLDLSITVPPQPANWQGLLERLGAVVIQVKAFFPEVSIVLIALAIIFMPFWNPRSRRLWFVMVFPAAYLVFGSISLTFFAFPPLHGRSFGLLTAFLPIGYVLAAKWVVGDIFFGRVYAFANKPKWLVGAVNAVIIAILVILNIGTGYENCRSSYSVRQYVSFIEAVDRAKTAYPEYPILLSDPFGELMGPLFLGRPQANVIWRNPLDKGLEKLSLSPPFVILAPLNKPTLVEGLGKVVQLGSNEKATLHIAEMVQPPAGRAEEILEVLAKSITVPSLPRPRPMGPLPTAMVLVDKTAVEASQGKVIFSSDNDRLPLVGQADNPVEQTAHGVVVQLEPGRPRTLTYSFFTNDDAQAAPQCFLGQFPEASGIFTLRFATKVQNHDRIPALVSSLYLYRHGKRVWSGDCALDSVPGEPVELVVSSPPGTVADAYRVVFTLKDIPPTKGTWSIENVQITRE
jgi:hypothetical protein